MKIPFVVLSIMLLNGCATTFKEEMLQDGNTWRVIYGNNSFGFEGCTGGYSADASDCIEAAKPYISNRGSELCGRIPARVFACGLIRPGHWVSCQVACNEKPRIEITPAERPSGSVEPTSRDEILLKAKKCQAKGGVWVNDACLIEIK